MMMHRSTRRARRAGAAIAVACTTLLGGCAAAIIGGTAGTAAVANDRRTTGSLVEDQAIELKAAKLLRDDPALDEATHVNVTSYNQVVLISGEADTEQAKQQVVELVRRIERVRLVHDEVIVGPQSSFASRSSDALLSAKVRSSLVALDDVDFTRINIYTERGIVYLMGLVSRATGDRVARAAAAVSGVQRVVKLFEYGVEARPAAPDAAATP